ncbi:MAG: hypothetical protein KDG52_04540 [Rhodocyclaceae bacterium]|nr:hypothetical protein [Rhodocyclaceae bacterium]
MSNGRDDPRALARIRRELTDSLDDLRLDAGERRRLGVQLQHFGDDAEVLRHLRNVAFDLVRTRLEPGGEAMPLLNWLERVVRSIDKARDPQPRGRSEAWFSPGDACRDGLVRELERARVEVCICVFTIADDRLTEAILAAHRRGLAIRILTDDDKRFDRGSDIARLRKAGIAVATDDGPAHMHHKFALFDGRVLVNGSFNWTRSASRANEENLLLTEDEAAVAAFSAHFEQLWRQFRD